MNNDEIVAHLLSEVRASVRPARYRKAMAVLGLLIAERDFPNLEVAGSKSYRVVSSIEDFDHIGLAVVDALKSLGGEVSFACYWTDHEVLMRDPWLDRASITRAYDQPDDSADCDLVIVASAVGRVSMLEAMALRAISQPREKPYRAVHVIAPIAHRQAPAQLRRKLGSYYASRFTMHGLAYDAKVLPDGYPRPGIGGSPWQRAGFESIEERRRYIPPLIRTLMQDPPSPDETPGGGAPPVGGPPTLGFKISSGHDTDPSRALIPSHSSSSEGNTLLGHYPNLNFLNHEDTDEDVVVFRW